MSTILLHCHGCNRRKRTTEFSERQATKILDRHLSDSRICLRCEEEHKAPAVTFAPPADAWDEDQPIGGAR